VVKKRPTPGKDYTEDVLGIGKDSFSDDPLRNLVNRYSPVPTVESPKGLVPIGDSGLYRTPDEPADPMDCDRYPSSPYCGENPFNLTPVGIEPSIVIDECNIGIQLEPTLGFIKLPPVSIVYRREECRHKKPKNSKERPPVEVDPNKPNRYNCIDTYYLFGIRMSDGEGEPIYVGTAKQYYNKYILPQYDETSLDIMDTVANNEMRRLQELYDNYQGNKNHLYLIGDYKVERDISRDYLEHLLGGINNPRIVHGDTYTESLHEFDIKTDKYIRSLKPPYKFNKYILSWQQEWYKITYYTYNPNRGTPLQFDWIPLRINMKFGLEESSSLLPDCVPNYFPPPPPIIRPKDMECCPEHTALLVTLIKKVDKLSKIVGVDEYPASLPASLISKDEGFLGNLIPNANREIPNLTQFLAWYVERFDEIMGQWEIPIEIKDSDPSKPGDQPLGVKLPNMAEALAEIFTLVFQTNLNSETLLNFAVRTAIETVTDKQQNFITYKLLQSITEWAGYKQKDIKLKMPILFSLGKTRYDEILNESEIDVACVDFDEKFGLEADLMRFREAVSILQANYKRKVDPSGDVKGQILKHLLDAFAAVNKVSGEDEDEDFEKFLTDVENGFTNTPGANNTNEPYGRPYNQRPKIRDLTKNDPPTNP